MFIYNSVRKDTYISKDIVFGSVWSLKLRCIDVVVFRWLGLCLYLLTGVIVFFAALFVVLDKDSISPGTAGLSISSALQVLYIVQSFIDTSSLPKPLM